MSKTVACTIVSKNYLAHARAWAEGLRAVHPDWSPVVLLVDEIDGRFDPDAEPFECLLADALPVPDFRRMAFRYSILELNTALKPTLLQLLFERDPEVERVLYLDPDLQFCAPLHAVEDALERGASFVLTPHLTAPLDDGHLPGEDEILLAGAYNLGFIALRRDARSEALLGWWQERLARECIVDLPAGRFVDQRWMDLAPGIFGGAALLRDPGYNVAYWNLRHRRITEVRDGWQVDGRPLAFFHWSGFDPLHPERLSVHQDRFAGTQELGDLRTLALQYADALHRHGFEGVRDWPYAYGSFSNGVTIPPAVRHAYRNRPALEAAGGDDPFALDPARFNEAAPELGRREPTISVTMASEWRRRTDLQRHFPDLGGAKKRGAQRAAFARAWRERIAPSDGIPDAFVPALPDDGPGGIDLVGYLTLPKGVGEAARYVARAIDVPMRAIDCTPGAEASCPEWSPEHATTLTYVNADMLPEVQDALSAGHREDAYRVGVWHWELPEFPDVWADRFARVDELWAPSRFIQSALAPVSPVPVVHMPHPIAIEPFVALPRAHFGIPEDAFACLSMYDLDSVQPRKNPQAAIEAFRKAFPSDPAAVLVIKVHHSARNPRDREALERAVASDERIRLIDGTLSRAQTLALIQCCDVFVSLHRSEGFGLICAEAMALGKPVIATGWSGNLDFMDARCAGLVRSRLVPLPRSFGPYAEGQRWAEPDLAHAAAMLARLAAEPELGRRIGALAARRIEERLGPKRIAAQMRARLQRIRRWQRQR